MLTKMEKAMLTKNRPTTTFADRVRHWSGEYEGDSKKVLAGMVVAYCNQTNFGDSGIPVVRQRARMAAQMSGLCGIGLLAEVLLIESHLRFPQGITSSAQAVQQLNEMRAEFVEAVTWLCSPKPSPGDQRFLAYFDEHGLRHFQKHLDVRDGAMQMFTRPLDLIDLLCVYLLRECQDKQPAEMPVKLCRGCHRFFSAADRKGKARVRKGFCSKKCQEGAYWKKRRADYRYVSRLLEEYSPPALRQRLENPKVQKRLDRIAARWIDWPKMVDMLTDIEEQAKEVPRSRR
jgi:hypothetical protein